MSNNKLDQSMQSVEAMSSIKIDHAVPVRTHTPSHAVVPDQEQQPSVTCRKLVLIGIATIGICAALYALVKYYSDSSIPYFAPYNDGSVDHEVWRSQPEIRVHSSELWLTVPYFLLFSMLSFMVILVACATSACVMLCGKEARKKAVEAERVLQELRRDTKSDASLAIPVAPFTRRRCPVGQDSDCLHIDWVPPVGGGATAYHLQWREQQGQDEVDRVLWSSSVASEKIGVPYYSTKQGSLRTQTAYQFRVRAFSAVSERWGPWSSPSKPTTVRPGKVLPCSPSHAPAPSMHSRTLQSP